MNLQAIITVNCMGFTLLTILMISSHLVRQRRQRSDRLFTEMIILTGLACLLEMTTFILDGKCVPVFYVLRTAASSFLFLANISVSLIWCTYVKMRLYREQEQSKKYYTLLSIPAGISVIAVLLNLKFHFIFRIDENYIYHREPIGYAFYGITLFYLLYSVFLKWQYQKKYGKSHFFPIYMFLTPILLGATVQFFFYGISIGWCCVALGLTGIHMSLQNELAYIDPLTRIYNRNFLNYVICQIQEGNMSAGGIMLDLDDFKSINDNYGHSAGDEALIDTAKVIEKSLPENAVPIRYAGDEFMILVKNATSEDMQKITETLRKSLDSFNTEHRKPYQLSFSIGYSIRQPDGETEAFLKEMDEKMYQEKSAKHCRRFS